MKKYALFLLPLLLLLLIDSTNAYAEEETTYTVVIASLKNPENAQNLAQTMEKLGLKVQVLKMDTPIGEMHRICVDKAPTQEQAKNINADVHQKTGNESSWVLSIENYSEVVRASKDVNNVTSFGKQESLAVNQQPKKQDSNQAPTNNSTVASTATGTYTVVFASLKNLEGAQRIAKNMKEEGVEVQIFKMNTSKGEFHRVCSEPVSSMDEAKQLLNAMNANGTNGWILSVPNYDDLVVENADINQQSKNYDKNLAKQKALQAQQAKDAEIAKQAKEAEEARIKQVKERKAKEAEIAKQKAQQEQKAKEAEIAKQKALQEQKAKEADIAKQKALQEQKAKEADIAEQKALQEQKTKEAEIAKQKALQAAKLAERKAKEAEIAKSRAEIARLKALKEQKAKEAEIAKQKALQAQQAKESELAKQKALQEQKAKEAEIAKQKELQAQHAKEAELAKQKALQEQKAKEAEIANQKAQQEQKAKEAELAKQKELQEQKAKEEVTTGIVTAGEHVSPKTDAETVDVATTSVSSSVTEKAIEKPVKPKPPIPVEKKGTDKIPNTSWTYGQFFEKMKALCYALENFDTENEKIIRASIDTIYGTYIQSIQEDLITSKLIKDPQGIYKHYSINKGINNFYREIYKVRRQTPKYTQIPSYDCELGAVPGNNIFVFACHGNTQIAVTHIESMTVRNKTLTEEEKEELLVSGISINVSVAIGGSQLIKALYFSIEDDDLYLRCIDLIDPCQRETLQANKTNDSQKENK